MPSFENLVIVVAVAFFAPLVLGLFPRVRLPSVVLEIVAGIVIGPSVLGLVEVDESVEVIALIGLAFVLFLAGLEIEFGFVRPGWASVDPVDPGTARVVADGCSPVHDPLAAFTRLIAAVGGP